jgi:nucleoside-diphosphate-sugar epimerase
MALVTGGSGYLASWTIVDLLKRGYRVRTTVRDLSREGTVRSMIARQAPTHGQLSFVKANLLDEVGWEQATAETDYVLHVASPMPVGEYRGCGTRRVRRTHPPLPVVFTPGSMASTGPELEGPAMR